MSKPTCCVYMDQNNIFFRYRKLDFKRLLENLKKEFTVVKAMSYMALDPKQDSQKKFITYLANNGWKCYTVDIGTNTNIDGVLMTDMMNDYRYLEPEWVVLISGDGDYSYTLDMLSKQGARVCVIGAKDYISLELLKVADKVMYIEETMPEIVIEPAGN